MSFTFQRNELAPRDSTTGAFRYRADCRACNLRLDLSAAEELVGRVNVEAMLPKAFVDLGRAEFPELAAEMDEERRKGEEQNRRAEAVERDLKERARREFTKHGCPHARQT